MSEMFHTVERAAERLAVHPKTVLRCIRDGRLRATRIGKAWRILASDLEAFAGAPADRVHEAARVTAIADLADVPLEMSQRLATALQSVALASSTRRRPMRLETVYDPERSHLKVIIVADALDAAAVLQTLHGFVEAFR